MGGYGSGVKTDKKRTVESCLLTLDIDALKVGFLNRQRPIEYVLKNHFNGTETPLCSITYNRDSKSLHYFGDNRSIEVTGNMCVTFDNYEKYIAIHTYDTNNRNRLWYFLCPYCHEKAKKLYMPDYDEPIACRKCHKLTYEKQQTHDKRFDTKNVTQTIINCMQNYKNSNTKEETTKNFFKMYFMATKLQTDLMLEKIDELMNDKTKGKSE